MPSTADHGGRSLVLALLVLLSGCAGLPAEPSVDAALFDSSSGVALGVGSDPVPTASPAVPNSEVEPADNPWGHTPIVVGVDGLDDGRDYASLVESAVTYWHENATETAYDPAFVVRPNASNPDVRVTVVEEITSCGGYHGRDAVGCAPILNSSSSENTTPVLVSAGYDDETTRTVITHEFGHLLGLTHDDAERYDVMGPRIETTPLPVPNATTRDYPYHDTTLTVYVDLSNVSAAERDAYEAEIDHALSYYESGAAGFSPEGLTLTRVSDPSRAQVVISVAPFEDGYSGARWRRTGESTDGDDAFEWYTGGDIIVDAGMGPTLVDWYVGSALGYLLAADDRSELPPPFRDSDLRDDPQWRGVTNESAW
ncbi:MULTISPECIES: hypothetical protein [Haloferax]|uniref:Matrixin n=2 Tax=Haloferax TaxID=2251 RepID=A0A6G1Z370_9EURY|nr:MULTISPECIES: hypothetical protein [Haloferax]KAB1188385.1 hypothetical protein Hfx1149_10235 [Haloferax sp. CBA1149]MRW81077.1 hypothetical protein [Haloferax marinisediminis]